MENDRIREEFNLIKNTLNDLVVKSGKIKTFTADYTIKRLIDLTGNIYNLLEVYEIDKNKEV
jgi:hypothetical protein